MNTPTVPFPVLSWSGRQGLVRVQRAFRARPTLTSLAKALLATGLPLQVETVSASTPPAIHPGAVPVAMANANADAHAVADVKNHIWSPRDPTADKFDHLASILQSLGTIRAMGSWLERTSIPYYQVGGGEGGRTSTRKVPSPRVCLSAFMIDAHPEVVLGGRGAEDPTAVAVQGAARALRDAMTALLVPFVAPWAPVQPVRWEVGGRNRDQVPGPTSPRSTATATANATGGWRTTWGHVSGSPSSPPPTHTPSLADMFTSFMRLIAPELLCMHYLIDVMVVGVARSGCWGWRSAGDRYRVRQASAARDRFSVPHLGAKLRVDHLSWPQCHRRVAEDPPPRLFGGGLELGPCVDVLGAKRSAEAPT